MTRADLLDAVAFDVYRIHHDHETMVGATRAEVDRATLLLGEAVRFCAEAGGAASRFIDPAMLREVIELAVPAGTVLPELIRAAVGEPVTKRLAP